METIARLFIEHFLTIAGFLLAVVLITRILRSNRRSGSALAWVMAIALIPYVGVPLYLVIGGRKLGRIVRRRLQYIAEIPPPTGLEAPPSCNAERLLVAAGIPPTRRGNLVVLHHDGAAAYTVLLEMIRKAQVSIHAMTFILGRDEVGKSIVDALAAKAAEGVEVRLILDGLGCIRSSGRFVNPIRRAGGKVAVYLPMLPLRRKWSANLRNHRKIVVVDGVNALVGGMNLGAQFMGPRTAKKRFVDSAVFLRGPAVVDIENVFLADWQYATDEIVTPESVAPPESAHGDGLVQVVASGPDAADDTLHDAFMTAIMEARERIWVVTPYFVPDDALLKVLTLQARLGVDVRLLVPKRSNHRVTDFARGPAVRQLLQAGAQVFGYHKGMNHAKALVFDETVAITGSPNLDMRSMYLNFEIALFHYSKVEIQQTAAWIEDLLRESSPLEPKPAGIVREWVEGFCALMSPML